MLQCGVGHTVRWATSGGDVAHTHLVLPPLLSVMVTLGSGHYLEYAITPSIYDYCLYLSVIWVEVESSTVRISDRYAVLMRCDLGHQTHDIVRHTGHYLT